MSKKYKAIIRFLIGSLILFGCTRKSVKPDAALSSDSPRITIGFSIDTFIIERWRRDCDVFMSFAKANGADVIVENAGNDEQTQIAQIRYLIDRNVNVLVIVPKNSASLSDVLQKARAKGIPVLSYDRLIQNADVSAYITVDSAEVGNILGEAVADTTHGGLFFCIYGPTEDYNMVLMDKGVQKAMDTKPGNMLLRCFTPEWNYDLSSAKMRSLLDSGAVPEAVICGNDAIAETVLRVLSEYRLNDIPVCGQDADIAACRRIVNGTQFATVYKPITELAQKAAEAACVLAKGKPLSEYEPVDDYIYNGAVNVPVIWLKPQLVTKDNIDEVVISGGFHNRNEIYFK